MTIAAAATRLQGAAAVVVCSGTEAAQSYLDDPSGMHFARAATGPDFTLDLADTGLLVVPNGSDNVAMARAAGQVRAFLDRGGTLACFDGWVTPWVPGNEWVMDNSRRTIEIRYCAGDDRHGLLDGVDVAALTFRHGISGWWACGYIDAAEGADIVLRDTWDRPVVVVDTATTNGAMVLTASGPVMPIAAPEDPSAHAVDRLYRNILAFAARRAAAQ